MYEEYDRAQLHDEVWSEPATVVAPRYGLSDVGLKKLCRRLEVPTPTRGHWAKVKAGRGIPPKPELKTFKGNRRYLFKRIFSNHTRHVEPEVVDDRMVALVAFEQDPANRIAVPARGTRLHPFVAASRDAFHSTFKDGRGLPLSVGKGLNIAVSVEQRSRALRIANALVRALETRGFLLVPGEHHLEVQMFGVRLGLNIFEATKRSDYEPTKAQIAEKARGERVYWPRYSFTPTGCLEIRSGSGASGSVKDRPKQVVEEQLNNLIVAMATQALGILRFRDECARAEALRQTQRSEALAQKAIQEVEQEKLESLRASACRWREAQEIRAYLLAMENSLAGCGGLNDGQHTFLRWARAKADWLDPLISAPDLLLDRKIHIPY